MRDGQVFNETVLDAPPSDFSGPRDARTIVLGYRKNDLAQPFTQIDYLHKGPFIGLTIGGAALEVPILVVAVLLIRRRMVKKRSAGRIPPDLI